MCSMGGPHVHACIYMATSSPAQDEGGLRQGPKPGAHRLQVLRDRIQPGVFDTTERLEFDTQIDEEPPSLVTGKPKPKPPRARPHFEPLSTHIMAIHMYMYLLRYMYLLAALAAFRALRPTHLQIHVQC